MSVFVSSVHEGGNGEMVIGMKLVNSDSMAPKLWWGMSHQPRDLDLIGKSAPMRALRRLMHSYAPYDVPLLLEGEEGTGKRLVAQIIHGLSPYRTGSFIAVDCSALSDMMLAVELFGCEAGFCSGLAQSLPGKLELAWGGSLLLERIELMPNWVQGRLLRVLKTKSMERLGGIKPFSVYVRIMAATTGCLSRTTAGERHKDLMNCLSGGIPLRIPPLRERRGDISLLSYHFLAMANGELGKQVEGFSPAARAALEAYSWPGNLRELYGVVQSAVLAADRRIRPEQLPLPNPARQASHVRNWHRNGLKRDRTPVPSASQTRAEGYGQRH
ncbi:MAG: sigma-54-dependent Fis family transcriptional regulator [Nitrospirae bacterium]|nr:MAG: sigma-54-dependent Fis family transcriptional regulator [Nitrospirota bacterium]